MSDVFVGALVVVGTLPAALFARGALWCALALRLKRWAKTSGIVIDTNESDGEIIFEYNACNEKHIASSKRTTIDCKTGECVALYYNPQKPKRHLLTQGWAPKKLGMISVCVGGLGIAFLVACYFFLGWVFR